jgi:hypothetical protein
LEKNPFVAMVKSELKAAAGSLRVLRRTTRFSAPSNTYSDIFASNALFQTASTSQRAVLMDVKSNWHRPEYDHATLRQNLMKYGQPTTKRCFRGDYLAILKKTMDEFAPATPIIPFTNGKALKHPAFPRQSSAGLPYKFEDGIRSKGDVIDKYGSSTVARTWDMIGRGLPVTLPDSLAFNRTVASEKTKSKIRPVWGYPFDVFAEEARYFYPLFDHLKSASNDKDLCYGIGMETALDGHAHIRRVFASIPGAQVLNADYSSFDAQVPDWLIRDVVQYMSNWFDFSRVQDSDGKIWDVNPHQSARRWKAMWSYFIKTKIRLPTGERFQKFHGVPSGSAFTNIIDTFCNAVATRTALYRQVGLPAKDYYYGDDSTIILRHDQVLDLNALSEQIYQLFGLEMHPDKTLLSDNPDNIHWLGYYARLEGPRRSGEFILASTVFPDREVVLPVDSAARLLGQLYSCMDPHRAMWFYNAVQHLKETYHLSDELIVDHVRSSGSKAMKYLTTLGLEIAEITMPKVSLDLDMQRTRIDAVKPKPTRRRGPILNVNDLPTHVFTPECYGNSIFRSHPFLSNSFDYNLYYGDSQGSDEYFSNSDSDSGYETA